MGDLDHGDRGPRRHPSLAHKAISLALAGLLLPLALGAQAQAAPAAAGPGAQAAVPRMADGKPDLDGFWNNGALTRLTRPPGVTKLTLTPEEADALVNWPDGDVFRQLAGAGTGFRISTGADWYLAKVKGEYRSSLIVDPADGLLPVTAELKRRLSVLVEARGDDAFLGPESLPLRVRCIVGGTGAGGPGFVPQRDLELSNYQIMLTPQFVTILVETGYDLRVAPIFRSKKQAQASHRPPALAPYMGDSVAWWEGDTLVIETTNVNPEQGIMGPVFLSEKGRVEERLTRRSKGEIFYAFTVDDPVFYTRPWSAEQTLNAAEGRPFEFGCHEGNYALPSILSGARQAEAAGNAEKEPDALGLGSFRHLIGMTDLPGANLRRPKK